MTDTTYISVVTYVYNEESFIQEYLLKLDEYLKRRFDSYEIIIVNDFSTDKTKDRIMEVKNRIIGNVIIIDLGHNHGVEMGMLAGTDISIGDFIFEIESSKLNFSLETIGLLYKIAVENGFDIVTSMPDKERRLRDRIYNKVLNKLLKTNIFFGDGEIRVVTRRALNYVINSREKMRNRRMIYNDSGFDSLALTYEPCSYPNNNKSYMKKVYNGFELLISHTDILVKLAFRTSFLFLLLGISFLIFGIIYNIKAGVIDVASWSLQLITTAGLSSILFFLGVISKYLSIILVEGKDKKLYTVKEIKRINRF